jgi:LmbE family N-acetylglucosaminyl deacetylase
MQYTQGMKKAPYNLLVVAHPDDESIFFTGLVLRRRKLPWRLVCATDGNADGRGSERALELRAAAKQLGIKQVDHWNYADIYEQRLPVEEIAERLEEFPEPSAIFTHNPLGEYGHPHHQDICAAVHQAFPAKKIFSPAYNCAADFTVALSKAELNKKSKIYAGIYKKEADRFLEQLPLSFVEGFANFSEKEALAMYQFFCGGALPAAKDLKKFLWMRGSLPEIRERISKRRF